MDSFLDQEQCDWKIPVCDEDRFPLLSVSTQCSDSNFDSLFVSSDVISHLEQIVMEFKDTDIFSTYNLGKKRRILLSGGFGFGKSFSAQIISSILNIPFVRVNFSSLISSDCVSFKNNLSKVFDFIKSGLFVVFFDDFDIINNMCGKNSGLFIGIFLRMLDNLKSNNLIFMDIGDSVDVRVSVFCRFNRIIRYTLPDVFVRRSIFEFYLKSFKKNFIVSDVSGEFAHLSEGLSPFSIKEAIEESFRIAIIDSRNFIQREDLIISIKRMLISNIKK